MEPLSPPEGSQPGERIWFGTAQQQADPAPPNTVQKKKLWETAQPALATDSGGIVTFRGAAMTTSAGAVKAETLTNARIG